MSRQITILAITDRDDKWEEMKAKYDDMSMADMYSLSKETEIVFEYFCNQEPRTDGKMYKRIDHTERHDDDSCESFYSFSLDGLDFEIESIVVVETP